MPYSKNNAVVTTSAGSRLLAGQEVLQAVLNQDQDSLRVASVQKKWRDSFSGSALNATKWDSTLGTGMTATVGSGTLTFASGTTASADGYIISKETFSIPFRINIGLTLSQRITNQDFIVEAVSCNPVTGVVDEQNIVGWLFNGTTATQAIYRVRNSGATVLASSATTIVTTASGGFYEIEPFADEAWFHSGTLDSTTGRSNSYRRHQQIPDPTKTYKIRIRWTNGGTAPASNTNAVIQYISVQDYAELTAEITAGRGNTVAGQALAVNITSGSVSVSGTATVGGVAAHDAAISGSPVRLAGRALTSSYTAVSSGDVADLITTTDGRLIVNPNAIPENTWQYAAASGGIVNTTDVAAKAAAATGIRNYITSIQVRNTNAVATEFVVKDGSTVIWRTQLPASMTGSMEAVFQTPLRGTAATAVNIACITTGAAVYANLQGYIAP